jgi:hypothetical protein
VVIHLNPSDPEALNVNAEASSVGLPLLAGLAGTAATGGNAGMGLMAASAVGAATAGYQQYRAAGMEAEQTKQAAETEKLDAKVRAVEIRREMMATLGAQDAALASRGVQVGQGTARTLTAETLGNFGQDLRLNRLNALLGRAGALFGFRQDKLKQSAFALDAVRGVGQVGYGYYAHRSGLGQLPGSKPVAKPVVTRTGYGGTIGGGV